MANIAVVAPMDMTPSGGTGSTHRIVLPPSSSSATSGLPRRASSDSLGFRFGKRNGSTGFLSVEMNDRKGSRTKSASDANLQLIQDANLGSERAPPLGLREPFIPIKSCLSSKSLSTDATTSAESRSSNAPIRKNVSFHTIEFREHERTLSDHPSVSSGPALGIGWSSIDSLQCTVAEYEQHRPPRRSKSHLVMPAHVREHILRNECQITQQEINASLMQTTRIKVSRSQASRDADTPRPPRLFPAFKFRKGHAESDAVDKQVELLLEQSLRAERVRKEQRDSYLRSLEQQLQAERNVSQGAGGDETSMESTEKDVPPPVTRSNDAVDDVNLESLSLSTASNPSALSEHLLTPFRTAPESKHETEETWEF